MLAWVVLPREQRRLAINSLQNRGFDVGLTQDSTDFLLAAVQGQDDWKEPSWMMRWLHRNLPAAYLRPVYSVSIREPLTPTEVNFKEIGRLGRFDWLFFQKAIEHPVCLQPLIEADNVHDALHFARHDVNAESLRQLSRLKNVRRIFFDNATVSPIGLSHLIGMEQLVTLELIETGCGDAGLPQVAKFSNLERLSLEDKSITANGFEQLASLTQLRKLEVGHLDEANLVGLSKAFSKMQSLNELYLHDASAQTALEAVANLPNLQRLDLTRSAFTDDSLEPLSRSQSLQSIELSDTQITEAGLMHVLKIATLKSIRGYRVHVSEEALLRLKASRPDVQFNLGR